MRAAFRNAIVIRPAVMFGRDDAFLNTLVQLLKRLPAYRLFGWGQTRLQPVHVEDVAEAIARAFLPGAACPATYEFGGPRVFTYEELLRAVADRLGKRPASFPCPLPHGMGSHGLRRAPVSPLSRARWSSWKWTRRLSRPARIGSPCIAPTPMEAALEQILAKRQSRAGFGRFP